MKTNETISKMKKIYPWLVDLSILSLLIFLGKNIPLDLKNSTLMSIGVVVILLNHSDKIVIGLIAFLSNLVSRNK
jgi:hypothetical protein